MFKSKRTELAGFMAQEKEMTRYLHNMLNNNMDVELASILFLSQFPDEEESLDDLLKEYYGE